MPTYCYSCDCGERFERTLPVARYREDIACPACGQKALRDIAAEHGDIHHAPGNWPHRSWACGVLPEQRQEAEAAAARMGVPTRFAENGDAIFESPRHRKRYCEAVGYYDRNGGYSDPQRK